MVWGIQAEVVQLDQKAWKGSKVVCDKAQTGGESYGLEGTE